MRILQPTADLVGAVSTVLARTANRCALGVDVSTRHTGLAVVSRASGLLITDVVSATVDENLLLYGDRIAGCVADHAAGYPFSVIAVEDIMKSFSGGRFSTQGLFKLARLNGIVQYAIWRRTGIVPLSAMPNAVRAYCGVRAHAVKYDVAAPASASDEADAVQVPESIHSLRRTDAVKHAALERALELFPNLPLERSTRTGSLRRTTFDRSDAVLCAVFALGQQAVTDALADDDVLRAACQAALTPRTLRVRKRPATQAAHAEARHGAAVGALPHQSSHESVGSVGVAAVDLPPPAAVAELMRYHRDYEVKRAGRVDGTKGDRSASLPDACTVDSGHNKASSTVSGARAARGTAQAAAAEREGRLSEPHGRAISAVALVAQQELFASMRSLIAG